MKGVSAIIAVILILMIVVALAALAYTWFSGIFTTLTTSASNATSSVTTAMGMQIRIEAAKFYGPATCGATNCFVNATIRNTGTSDVNIGRLGAYIGSRLQSSIIPPSGTLSPGSTVTLNITNTTAACPNVVLTITTESGLSDYRTITC